MAARQVAADATIEQLRTTFNTLSATDFGDISQLSSSISASNLVAAMNELEAEVAGFSASTITAQTNLGAAPATADEFVIVDASAGTLKALTVGNLFYLAILVMKGISIIYVSYTHLTLPTNREV